MFGGGKEGLEGLHLAAESSEETISEAQRLSDEICQMLVAAGYFRARIPSLGAFDKMLGGLAWCITASNVDVDVDLDFDEEMTLGQKIKLGENVIAALRKMDCPYRLQPHQLRGLDFQSLFTVFQWLVKNVLSTREERAAQTRRFAEMKFNASKHELPQDAEDKRRRSDAAPLVEKIQDKYKPKRQFKMRDTRKELSEAVRVQCVLLEYGHSLPSKAKAGGEADGNEENDELDEEYRALNAVEGNLDFLSGKRIGALVGMQADAIQSLSAEYSEHAQMYGEALRDPEAAARRGKEQAHKRLMASLGKQLDTAKTKCKTRQAAYDSLSEQVKETQNAIDEQKANIERVLNELEKLKKAETPENTKDLEVLMRLVTINESLKEQEDQFRNQCKRQRADLQSKIDNFEESGGIPEEEMERLKKVEALYEAETEKLQKLRALLARKTQQVHVLKRKIDDIATRGELVQYERRFVELYEQVAANLEETRKYYNKYNTLTDAHKYLNKEISIMNSIGTQYGQISASESQRNNFVNQIETIRNGVQENLNRVKTKYQEESKTRDALAEKLTKVLERQRVYFKAVKEFQEECTRNELLLSQGATPSAPAPPQTTPAQPTHPVPPQPPLPVQPPPPAVAPPLPPTGGPPPPPPEMTTPPLPPPPAV